MAPLLDKLFIDKTAFETYRDVSEHMDNDQMNASIREAQITDLVDFLGAELYLILQEDFTEPDTWTTPLYGELFNGIDYDYKGKQIRMHGIQPMLTLYAYARMLDNLQLGVTRLGPVTWTEAEVSDPTSQAQIKTKVIGARAMAQRYRDEIETYLSNSTDFPEWIGRSASNKKQPFYWKKI